MATLNYHLPKATLCIILWRMAKKFWVLGAAMVFLFSCQKQVKVRELPGYQPTASDREFIAQYRALKRAPVSAGFSVFSLLGSFKGELYLEPGEKTQSLVYGYMPLGKSLFEFKLSGGDFLYLDLGKSYAYSNRKDWLSNSAVDESSDKKDYAIDVPLNDQDQMALMLISALRALAGELPEPLTVTGENPLVVVSGPGTDHAVKYFFSLGSPRLAKMEVNKQDSTMSLEFEYSGDLWFPAAIKMDDGKTSAQLKMEKITCPETNRPRINFEIPEGFVKILLTGR
jgi:hypothetical protein